MLIKTIILFALLSIGILGTATAQETKPKSELSKYKKQQTAQHHQKTDHHNKQAEHDPKKGLRHSAMAPPSPARK